MGSIEDPHPDFARNILGKSPQARARIDEHYHETGVFVKSLFQGVERGGELDGAGITGRIDFLIEEVAGWREAWLAPIYRYDPEDYLYTHSLNVTILSLLAGMWLGYNKSKLKILATGALLSDIGIPRFMDTCLLPRRLTQSEGNAIKSHSMMAAEIMRQAGLDEQAVQLVLEHHERFDRKGYPHGIGANAIHESAQIVGVMDTYDALIHTRPYRKRFMPEEAIKEILAEREAYSPRVVKLVLERIGLYPPGSWVMLSTGEIARIAEVNKGYLFRPTVSVIFNREREMLSHSRTLDLSKQTIITIERSLDEAEFKLSTEQGYTA